MSISTVLVVLLILLLVGALPATGLHSAGWYPSGGIGLLLVILLVLIIAGRL